MSVDSVDKVALHRAGPVTLDQDCLSCAGVPSHTMELFKMACIQYKPGSVNYRHNTLSRKKLLGMRKTLIDKCEEVINNNGWPHGSQDLRTGKIFKDLLQFYGTVDQSIYSDGSGMHDQTTLPQSNASFMPAISQRTLINNSMDDGTPGPINHDISTHIHHTSRGEELGKAHNRKHSVPQQGYLPLAKGITGSGATLNSVNMKRPLNNTVTIKTNLEVRSIGQ